ncbi:MAG: oligosaccharide flippase family protein [Candidatus Omnitrophica bacterium]|nr:oligosaccharide flippase family protein [Candidatus Omnitrophota bacterium]
MYRLDSFVKLLSKLTNKYNDLSQLKKNVLSGAIFSGLNILVTLISYPIYLKYLGVELYGVWVTLSVILTYGLLGEMGMGTAIMRSVAGEYAKKDILNISKYITTAIYLLLIPTILILGLLMVFNKNIAAFLKIQSVLLDSSSSLILGVGVLSIFCFYLNLIKGVLAGVGRMDIANYIYLICRILQIMIAVILLVSGYGVWGLYLSHIMFYIFAFSVSVYILFKHFSIIIFYPFLFNIAKCKELIKFGGVFMTGSIANMLVIPFNKIIIARYVGLSEVAYYQIATQVIFAVRGLFVKGLESIIPKISNVNKTNVGSKQSVLQVHAKCMKLIFFCAIPIFLFLFVFSNQILSIWLGEEFNIQISIILKILAIGWFFNALAVPDHYMFIGIGKVLYSASEKWVRLVLNFGIILFFILSNFPLTLTRVTLINCIGLIISAIWLKILFYMYKFTRNNMTGKNYVINSDY